MKKALITGASSGIGLATAELLNQQSMEVTGIGRTFDESLSQWMQTIQLDLSDLNALDTQLKHNADLQQAFDVIVFNAGYGRFGCLEQFSSQQIQHLVNTNLTSNLLMLRHYLSRFKTQGGGQDIVLIGSEAALNGAKYGAVYCATKFALRGLAQSLKAECANNNIRVILLNPGAVNTAFFDQLDFFPAKGEEFAISAQTIAQAISHALATPRNTIIEEINLQPSKRVFSKR